MHNYDDESEPSRIAYDDNGDPYCTECGDKLIADTCKCDRDAHADYLYDRWRDEK